MPGVGSTAQIKYEPCTMQNNFWQKKNNILLYCTWKSWFQSTIKRFNTSVYTRQNWPSSYRCKRRNLNPWRNRSVRQTILLFKFFKKICNNQRKTCKRSGNAYCPRKNLRNLRQTFVLFNLWIFKLHWRCKRDAACRLFSNDPWRSGQSLLSSILKR